MPAVYVHVSAGGLPGSGLPISATGMKNIAWPIAIVSVIWPAAPSRCR